MSESAHVLIEAAPRRWVCHNCGKSFGHRPRGRHRSQGRHCDGVVAVFVLIPEKLARRLLAEARP